MNAISPDTDLSGDDQARTDPSPEFNAQARLYTQRHDQRKWLFVSALLASATMAICFIGFVASVLCWIWVHPSTNIDWHVLLLGSALIVPPTLVVWNLMKQVFRSDGKLENGKGNDGGTGVWWSDVIKEALDAFREWFKSKGAN